ncbi:unnamed protein product [marine sediment metagenome]|uniref:Uncharacterized protein n=1 Tax=marine sediment metagenome TaxID=412755 RepID=X1ANP4_9ZZZZ
MKVLNMAVEKERIHIINEKSKEISLIFENVWRDADKLEKKIGHIKHGISFGIGIIGAIITMPIAGVGGLLSGLGFEVVDKILENKAHETISEKIMKIGTQSPVLNIYDFKKKYKLFHR